MNSDMERSTSKRYSSFFTVSIFIGPFALRLEAVEYLAYPMKYRC